ncbi:MAG TPA: nickel transporter permease [Phototrophicaceae bacterium]|nr:nickel transporter permease [Phototrophicaceae bacterium]
MTQRVLSRWLGNYIPAEPGSTVWFFRRDKIAYVSLIFLLVLFALAILAPLLTPYANEGLGDPNIANKFIAPVLAHPFGTDSLGRDLLARVLFGARTSLSMGLLVVVSAVIIGTPLGALAGYYGGWVDEVIMRVTDIFLAFPPLLLAVAIAAALGPGYVNAVIAIAITWWPWYTRLVRAQAISLRERDFVEAARGIGVSNLTIIRRHILPNVLTPVLVQSTIDIGSAILTVAGLSFIGLGPQPPIPDWGVMVNEGRLYVQSGRWWLVTFPGLAIFFTALAFNLLGDGVRDAADPRTRGAGN